MTFAWPVLAATLLLAACGGGSSGDSTSAAPPAATTPPATTTGTTPATPAASPPPATTGTTPTTPTAPAATTPPAPAASAAPVVPAGFRAVPNRSGQFFADANGNTIVDAGERVLLADAAGHYYELFATAAVTSYAQSARQAAAHGGHLFTPADAANLEAVRAFVSADPGNGLALSAQPGKDLPMPAWGAFIGLQNAAPSRTPALGWFWIASDGTANGTGASVFTAATPTLWNKWYTASANPAFVNPGAESAVGALSEGFVQNGGLNQPLFSAGNSVDDTAFGLTHYVVEYESGDRVR